jgi:hypothetical protein
VFVAIYRSQQVKFRYDAKQSHVLAHYHRLSRAGMLTEGDPGLERKASGASSIYVDAPELASDVQDPNKDTSATAHRGEPIRVMSTSSANALTSSAIFHSSPVSETPQSSLHAIDTTALSAPPSAPDETTLTPLRAHYLKKSLVTLQFSKELLGFTELDFPNLSPLSYLGQPFTPPPKGAPRLDVPFLRFFFRQFVLTFPFIASAPKDFFPMKVQPFVASLVGRNLSTTEDVLGMDEPDYDPELRSRQKIIAKAEKYFGLVLGNALKMTEPEEVVRLSQRDLDRLEALAKRRAARAQRTRNSFDVNIICVRSVVEKGRVRSRVHEEFIIRTRRDGFQDILVSRRYGDFRTLAEEVRVLPTVYAYPKSKRCSFGRRTQNWRLGLRHPRIVQ